MLYQRYRPKRFADVLGHSSIMSVLWKWVENKKLPHCILLEGGSGTGKTTIARIIARKIGCEGNDLIENNSADFRGIDSIRRIINNMTLAPNGKARVWILDECFPPDTLVNTETGPIPISMMMVGDSVISLGGSDIVTRVFKNKVALDRLVRLNFNDGSSLFTTKDHLFLHTSGWISAKDLLKIDLYNFGVGCYPMQYENKTKVDRSMCLLPKAHREDHKTKRNWYFDLLFKKLRGKIQGKEIRAWKKRATTLFGMWQQFLCQSFQSQKILQSFLLGKEQAKTPGDQNSSLQQKSEQKNKSISCVVLADESRKTTGEAGIQKDEMEQPIPSSGSYRKNEADEERERNSPYLERNERGQRTANRPPDEIIKFARSRMEVRTSDLDRVAATYRFSDELQSRLRQFKIKNSGRDRWQSAQIQESKNEGQKENQIPRQLRVESIEVYKRGSNDESFASVISNQSRKLGYVEFYDLQVEKHPSYFANGFIVHNCHGLTSDAQDAFLKALEDTPSHVYFILCSTDPHKLKKTILTRCSRLALKPIDDDSMHKILNRIKAKESIELVSKVQQQIIVTAEGSAREAIVLLEKVSQLETEEEQLELLTNHRHSIDSIELCRALINRAPWKEVVEILKQIDDDPERVRHLVLAYANSCLYSGLGRAALIINHFRDNFYDGKKAALTVSCWEVTNKK